jgi:beta-1,4-N-acetylglucosaminyltransferase
MLSLVGALNLQRYAPRYYIAAVTDSMSLTRAATLEDHLQKCALSTSSSSSSQVFSLHFDLAHLQI